MKNTEVTKEWLLSHGGICNELVCDVCGEKFLDGMDYHPGHVLHGYEMYCCKICWEGNWDGWNPSHEKKILTHLKEKGISPPPRNAKGWLPREF